MTAMAWSPGFSLISSGRSKAIEAFAEDPRPAKSKAIEVQGLIPEVRRLRLERWRIVYAITDADALVDVLAIRKRPPYDYGNLEALQGLSLQIATSSFAARLR